MKKKDFEKMRYLEGIDNFGENIGGAINKSAGFVWSKFKFLIFALSAGSLVLILSLINGLTGRNKQI